MEPAERLSLSLYEDPIFRASRYPNTKMIILTLLFTLVIGHPMHREKTCSATCSGITNEWKSFQGNGVSTTGEFIPNDLVNFSR